MAMICPEINDPWFNELVNNPERKRSLEQNQPYLIFTEICSKCMGSCSYCYSSSDDNQEVLLDTDVALRFIEDAISIGIKELWWFGGDPLLHPEWDRIVGYAGEKGLRCLILLSGLISKKNARKIAQYQDFLKAFIHLDTIDPDIYSQVHTNPKTLEKKIEGYHNLLEAGYPTQMVIGCLTVTKQTAQSAEKTIDWYKDEMGARYVFCPPYKPQGFGKARPEHWEPSLSDVKRVMEYKAKKFGQHWLDIGPSDGSKFLCRTHFAVLYDGSVTPCTCIRDQIAGNIYQERLPDIFKNHGDELLYNFPIKGYCAEECEHRDVCIGCRSNAYLYLKDVRASDPKCWLNPEAKEFYFK